MVGVSSREMSSQVDRREKRGVRVERWEVDQFNMYNVRQNYISFIYWYR